jgi:pimeloyl-ACP methyl ester carboxylesterase
MTPGTVVLLHGPLDDAAAWADLSERLSSCGLAVIAPDLPAAEGMRYVAQAALVIAATKPEPPLLLVGQGGAGPLLPALAMAQRAAHRPVSGYLFLDADLPVPAQGGAAAHSHDDTAPQAPADWPDAPCGYLRISERYEQQVKVAALRGWRVARHDAGQRSLAESIRLLIEDL